MTYTAVLVYPLIFCFSIIYVYVLNWWQRRDPVGFYRDTWFQVVVGITYTGLPLLFIQDTNEWLKWFLAFVISSLPIITRSLFLNGHNHNSLNGYHGGKEDE